MKALPFGRMVQLAHHEDHQIHLILSPSKDDGPNGSGMV